MLESRFLRGAPAEVRLWGRVVKGDPADESACWEWSGAKDRDGYGWIRYGGRNDKTHRVAWILTNGPIHAGMCVCHRCDNPSCCRPSHLFLGSNEENTADRHGKKRDARGEKNGARVRSDRLARGERNGQRLHPERTARGESHPAAKLNDAAVLEMRQLSAAGVSVRDLAARFNVSHYAAWDVVRRRSWRHLP